MRCPHCHEEIDEDNINYRPFCSSLCKYRGETFPRERIPQPNGYDPERPEKPSVRAPLH